MDEKIDVIMCVGKNEINTFFILSIKSCIKNFGLLDKIYIITPDKTSLEKILIQNKIKLIYHLLDDKEIIDANLMNEDSWYKQQLIKLYADKISNKRFIAFLSSDTILLKKIAYEDLFNTLTEQPIIYFRKYSYKKSKHYKYEQQRLSNVAKILKIKPASLLSYTDFILDFNLWDSIHLKDLRKYLKSIYGDSYFGIISPKNCKTLEDKKNFGEWTLYSAFVIYVLKQQQTIKAFDDSYFTQIHSYKDLSNFIFNTKIVHFVHKNLPLDEISSKLQIYL